MLKEATIIKSIPFKYGEIMLRSDNIIAYYPKTGVKKFTLPHLEQMLAILLDLTKDSGPLPYFSDNRNLMQLDSDAKNYIIKHMDQFASAFAMTEDSTITRFLTHSLLTFWKPPFPLKMFKTEEEAINWLKQNN